MTLIRVRWHEGIIVSVSDNIITEALKIDRSVVRFAAIKTSAEDLARADSLKRIRGGSLRNNSLHNQGKVIAWLIDHDGSQQSAKGKSRRGLSFSSSFLLYGIFAVKLKVLLYLETWPEQNEGEQWQHWMIYQYQVVCFVSTVEALTSFWTFQIWVWLSHSCWSLKFY